MKLRSRKKKINDPVLSRVKNSRLEDIVSSNLTLQSVNRELTNVLAILPKNVNTDYFFGSDFKVRFNNYSDDKKVKFCRLVAGIRYKDLLKELGE